ncbi:MAG: Do family serine endopeptidase [Bacteroidota bacterium]
MKKQIILSALVAFLVSALTFGGFQYFQDNNQKIQIEHVNTTPASSVLYAKDTDGDFVPMDFTKVAEQTTDAVVHIKSTATQSNTQNPYAQRQQAPDIFERFFGPEGFGQQSPQRQRSPQARVGTGSGVIINEDGYIVTNNHVIDNADDIEVTLYDNRTFKAKVIGVDPTTDLALIQIKEKGLPYVPFADSDNIKVGEWVVAVGNPFNLNSTVTAGIVSAKGRSINILREQYAIESFIQTDAAINPGNSGGALVRLDGSLVGINTAIASPTGAYSGYGFAVPSNIVQKVVGDLLEYGTVQRGYLGAMIRGVDANLVKEKELSVNTGVYLDKITEASAADEAGLRAGDVVVAINGNVVKTNADLLGNIAGFRPGETIDITVNRSGSEKTFAVTLKNKEGNTELLAKESLALSQKLGATLQTLEAETAEKLDLAGGVRVTKIVPGTLRKSTNMQDGFIITSVDGQRVRSVEELEQILGNKKGGVMVEGRYEDSPETFYYAFGIGA